MILLTNTSSAVAVVSGSAGTLHVHASWVDLASGGATVSPGDANAIISTATITTVVAAPAASTARNVKFLSVYNAGASQTVTITHNDSSNTVDLYLLTIPAGYTLTYGDEPGWQLFDSSGNLMNQGGPGRYLGSTVLTSASGTFTTQGKTNTIRIRGVGGGGGGAGCTSVASAASAGGGGGGGGYLEKTVSVSGGTGYSYTCGALGAGASGAAGGNGGNSTFVVGATTYTANGGTGGPVATAVTTAGTCYAGGAGGAVSTNGDVNGAGQPGGPGIMTAVTPLGISGVGGSSIFGGGGASVTAAGNGNAGAGHGSGGGGALTGASTVRTGGSGTAGMWVVDEYS